jgi:hypothetical protein
MLEIVKFIKNNKNWRDVLQEVPYCLSFDETEDYLLLKYRMGISDFSNVIVQECRGLILKKPDYKPVCVPFYKFFNYGESNAHNLDWESAKFEEKIDGSLIKMWHNNGVWHISTNGKIDAACAEIENLINTPFKNFKDLFMDAWKRECVNEVDLNQDYTYMFELTSPHNRVVTPHEDIKIRHIGTRNNKTLKELEEDISIEKPKKYPFKSLEDCLSVSKSLPYDEEGYIVVDKHYNRVKIKSPSYVAMHHVVSKINSTKNILEVILKGEMEEVLNYFPELEKKFKEIDSKLNNYLNSVKLDIKIAKKDKLELERKYYADWAKNSVNPSVMFKIYDNHDFNWEEMIRNTNSKRVLQMIGVK